MYKDKGEIHLQNNTDTQHRGLEGEGETYCWGICLNRTNIIHDIHVVDTDAPSYLQRDPKKVLQGTDKYKNNKYLEY